MLGDRIDHEMNHYLNRRKFITTLGLAAAGSAIPTLGASANKNSKLRILQIGVGGIGGMDRGALSKHPKVEIAGLCDVDKNVLGKVARQFSKAKTYTDCRDAFAKDMDEYDAVLVCTPDHTHAVMALEALSHNKHLYLQKPVVQQLDELRMLKKAVAAKPALATQMGNQRSAKTGRKQAVEIIRSGALGKAISAWAWTGTVKENAYFDKAWPSPRQAPCLQRATRNRQLVRQLSGREKALFGSSNLIRADTGSCRLVGLLRF